MATDYEKVYQQSPHALGLPTGQFVNFFTSYDKKVVSDIREFQPPRLFDVIVIDRTLHMPGADERNAVLSSILSCSAPASSVLIADERSNIQGLQAVFDQSGECWNPILKKGGYLFMRHTPSPAGKSAGHPRSR